MFYALRAGVARRTSRAGAWPFWVVQRSSEFAELSCLWFSTNDRQSSHIQIVNHISITAIPHRRTGTARCTAHTGAWTGAGAAHRTKPTRDRRAVACFQKICLLVFGYDDTIFIISIGPSAMVTAIAFGNSRQHISDFLNNIRYIYLFGFDPWKYRFYDENNKHSGWCLCDISPEAKAMQHSKYHRERKYDTIRHINFRDK